MTKPKDEIVDITCKIVQDNLLDLDPIDILDIVVLLQYMAMTAIHQERSIKDIYVRGF